jgi:hypothetical protein
MFSFEPTCTRTAGVRSFNAGLLRTRRASRHLGFKHEDLAELFGLGDTSNPWAVPPSQRPKLPGRSRPSQPDSSQICLVLPNLRTGDRGTKGALQLFDTP